MEYLKKLSSFFITVERRSSLMNERQRRSVVHGDEADEEEEFSYPTTRCLSSYYSIFVARLAIMLYQMMKDITWAVFASRKALNAITISYRNGFVQAFHRDHRSNTTFYIYSELVIPSDNKTQQGQVHDNLLPSSEDVNVSSMWYREPLNPDTGDKMGDRRQIPPDDLINIAGLPEVQDGAASWRIAVSKFTDSPLLSAALPVRHPSNGSIVAAVGVTTALKSVGQLMKELVGFHSGYMYLTSREGYILATSTDAPLLRNTTGCLKLVMANDSDNPIIRSGAKWLPHACRLL